MSELFVKEWRLAAPAVDVMFVFLGALVLVPAYPYGMVFFFGMLAAFFSCQFARFLMAFSMRAKPSSSSFLGQPMFRRMKVSACSPKR